MISLKGVYKKTNCPIEDNEKSGLTIYGGFVKKMTKKTSVNLETSWNKNSNFTGNIGLICNF